MLGICNNFKQPSNIDSIVMKFSEFHLDMSGIDVNEKH